LHIYIYLFQVLLSADFSSGAHREGFHLNFDIRISVCIKPFLDF
jgi:hypothetical protein